MNAGAFRKLHGLPLLPFFSCQSRRRIAFQALHGIDPGAL